ncbi:TPA: response regulator transcription factor [Aeromonas hydrophila]|nr:response regulator transcription factor [Aeromonas hydrophila]
MKKIIIVDDHPVVVMALRILLEQNGFNVTATANNGIDALQQVKMTSPDIVIIDIGIPLLDGIEVIKRIRQQSPSTLTLVLTAQPSHLFSTRCFRAGASGFISKLDDLSEVIGGLNAISSGYTYFPSIFKETADENPLIRTEIEVLESLSSREIIILQQLSSGFSNKEIAERMLLSEKTISTYKKNIMRTINVNNLIEMVDMARRNGIV